jgi:hypothetical protein
MSTTIDPAFRVSSDANLFDVAEELRAVLIPYLTDKFRREAVSMALNEFDSLDEIDSGLRFAEFLEVSVLQLRRNLVGDFDTYSKFDLLPFNRILDFHAVFLRNGVRGETYLLPSQDALGDKGEELVLGVKGIVSDYSYWNGSDSQIAHIGEEEWLDRRQAWKETLQYSTGVVQQGLVVKLFERLSAYELASWKKYKGQGQALVAESAGEERFRRVVFHQYLDGLRKVYPDLDIMSVVSGSWRFMNPKRELNYTELPYAEEQEDLLKRCISYAEKRVADFPIVF